MEENKMREQFKFMKCKICGKEIYVKGDNLCGTCHYKQFENLSYSDLLLTDEWKNKRGEIIQRDNNKCTKCGEIEQLQVHHTYYLNRNTYPWDYPNECLITLCEKCHNDFHSNNKNEYKKIEYGTHEEYFEKEYGKLEEYFEIIDLTTDKKSDDYFIDYIKKECIYLLGDVYVGKTKNLYSAIFSYLSEMCPNSTINSKQLIHRGNYMKKIILNGEKIKVTILTNDLNETKKLIQEYFVNGYPLTNRTFIFNSKGEYTTEIQNLIDKKEVFKKPKKEIFEKTKKQTKKNKMIEKRNAYMKELRLKNKNKVVNN